MTDRSVPTGISATATIAALTWRRLLRGRALWVSVMIALLPVLFAVIHRRLGMPPKERDLFVFETLILVLLAPMFVASSIGEEIEDRTTTYLWSRPVPRWAVVSGKLCTLVPVTFALLLGSFVIALRAADAGTPSVLGVVALAAGTLAISLVAAAIATLAPKHGMALAIAFLLVDLPLGALPATLQELSVTHQIRALSNLWALGRGSATSGAIGLTVLAVVWGVIAALRIRRLEA